jgi:predicted phosphodiesterase
MKAAIIAGILMLCVAMYAENTFRFVVVGDRTGGAVEGVFEGVLDEVKLFDPDFVMCVGDLIEGYSDDTLFLHAQWDSIVGFVEKLACPFYYVAGNHDIQNLIDRRIYEQRTKCKRYYSFDHKGSHFIILDNTMTYWPEPEPVDSTQIAWLKADLEAHKHKDHIFVFYHLPTYIYAIENGETDELAEIFETYQVDAVFTGHHHTYSYMERNGVEYINVGSSGAGMNTNEFTRGNFYHYLWVTVRDDECEIAVIRKDNVFARNVVTLDDLFMIDRVTQDAITITPFQVEEGSQDIRQIIEVTIDHIGAEQLTKRLVWTYDSSCFLIAPETCELGVLPGEQKSYAFTAELAKGSDVFPVPQLTVLFPFAEGKSCTVTNYLFVKRVKQAKKVARPVIDGKLTDATWKMLKPITNLGTYNGQPNPPVEETEVYLGYDEDNVYLGARCYDTDLSQLVANAVDNDAGSPRDDNLWFFFDTNNDQTTYYQAIINANGAVFDRQCRLENGQSIKDIVWNGPWEIATGRESDAWTLEIRIPKEGLKPYDVQKWGFNFRRLQPRKSMGDAGYWTIPFGHAPQYFGVIEFK